VLGRGGEKTTKNAGACRKQEDCRNCFHRKFRNILRPELIRQMQCAPFQNSWRAWILACAISYAPEGADAQQTAFPTLHIFPTRQVRHESDASTPHRWNPQTSRRL